MVGDFIIKIIINKNTKLVDDDESFKVAKDELFKWFVERRFGDSIVFKYEKV